MSDSMKNLAMALSVKRRKKMAKGGAVSAATEKRPMPDQKANDSKDVSQNSMKKPLMQADMTSQPERKQSMRGMKTTPIKHPRMVASDVLQSRLLDQEDHLERSAAPASPKEHIRMADGGMINEEVSMHKAEEDMEEHPAGLESDNDSMGDKDAMDDHMVMLAHGGELEEDHHDSIAAAIMAKRRRMAEGGQVDLDLNAMEQPEDFDARNEAILKENYDEDMHSVHEPMDSNEHGHELPDEDMHDMVSKIRSQMNKRRQFKG